MKMSCVFCVKFSAMVLGCTWLETPQKRIQVNKVINLPMWVS